jgi:hypothetical protein
MSSGQEQIVITSETSLDTSLETSNIAENEAILESTALPNVDGKDIYPNQVVCQHLFAADGIIQGSLQAGSIYVGAGGVAISSAADGATPTTGILLSTSQIKLLSSGVETVTLNGSTGTFTLQSAASGARVVVTNTGIEAYDAAANKTIDINSDGTFTFQSASSGARMAVNASGLEAYNSSNVKTVDINSADGTFALQNAASGARTVFSGSGLLAYDSGGTNTVKIDATDGKITATSFLLQTAASGSRLEVSTTSGFKLYEGTTARVTIDTTDGVTITSSSAYSAIDPQERLSFVCGNDEAWIANTSDKGLNLYSYTGLRLWDGLGFVTLYGGSVTANNFICSVEGAFNWPCIVTASGSMSATDEATTYYSFKQIGPYVFFRFTVTLGGTASNTVYLTLPVDASSAANLGSETGFGRCSEGDCFWTGDGSNDNVIAIVKQDSSNYATGSGKVFRISGFYTAV